VISRFHSLPPKIHWDRTSQEAGIIRSRRHTEKLESLRSRKKGPTVRAKHGHEASELKLLLDDDQPSGQVGIEQQKEEREGGGDKKEYDTSRFDAVKCRC
jgi:hypothetical protein